MTVPTAQAINSLPEWARLYIHDLETNADPAGLVQEVTLARDTIAGLAARIAELEAQAAAMREALHIMCPAWRAEVSKARKWTPEELKNADVQIARVEAASRGDMTD